MHTGVNDFNKAMDSLLAFGLTHDSHSTGIMIIVLSCHSLSAQIDRQTGRQAGRQTRRTVQMQPSGQSLLMPCARVSRWFYHRYASKLLDPLCVAVSARRPAWCSHKLHRVIHR